MSASTKRVLVRIMAIVAAGLLLTGGGLLAFPYYTDQVTNQAQRQLSEELETVTVKENFEARQVPMGAPVARLKIPAIGLDTVVVEGATLENLKSGAAHYEQTALPGEPGNVAIAGHRTTYGKPFHDLDKLESGDQAILDTPSGPYVYEMLDPFDGHPNPWRVEPGAMEVIDPTPENSMTLTTCHPKGSARERLIARFILIDSPDETPVAGQAPYAG